ncbi:hypothetical protein T03_936 [Trichinella britovi]|uniref:Retrovirus-related Pol polyprotein from transposon TNT 1-94 n=1 Tax=Trichinella britovi TaxID=45882 RepID=A0A0V1DK19_TRIBR|nr:hypothetical protein T03_936 [Trichinella britovi]
MRCVPLWCSDSMVIKEAEYMALSHAHKKPHGLRSSLIELEKNTSKPTLLCSNSGAVSISTGQSSSARTRHIDIRHHFVKEKNTRSESSGCLCEANWDGSVKWGCWKSRRHPHMPNY